MTPDMVGRLPLAELDELVRSAWSAVAAGHLDEDTAQAVSYTHLTLPTSDLV